MANITGELTISIKERIDAMPAMQEHDRLCKTKANTKGGEKAKGGEEMTKSEYQRYKRIVLRFFPPYLDYQLYRRPKKCKMMKVIKDYKAAKK